VKLKIIVRPEAEGDAEAIRAVHLVAFHPSTDEAGLVPRLHQDGDCVLSLVAEHEGEIVGHVMLSRMRVSGDGRAYRGLGLAPVGVRYWAQDGGVGTALIRAALAGAEALGEQVVFVVGDPDYYVRFGFSADAAAPFASPYAGRSWFMALWLDSSLVPPVSGTAAYPPAFAAWDELG
jgi:putative acetyltransferase